MKHRWKGVLYSSEHALLGGEPEPRSVLSWFQPKSQSVDVFRKGVRELDDTIIHTIEHQRQTADQAFYKQYISKSKLPTTLFQLDTLQEFGTSDTTVLEYVRDKNTHAYESDYAAFQNADALTAHLQQLLHVGEAHMLTHEAFAQQLDWHKVGLGFENELRALTRVRALRVSQLVKQSRAMKDLLNAHQLKRSDQWVHKLTLPHTLTRLHDIHRTLHQLQEVVRGIEPYQDTDLGTRLDSVDQKFVQLQNALPNKVFSWFRLDYVKEHRTRLNLLSDGYLTDPVRLAQEEFAFLHREDVDAEHVRRHFPDPVHRRMHFLYLYCKHARHTPPQNTLPDGLARQREAERVYNHAMEQFALHQPASFATFVATFEQDQQWMEANVYSSKSQFTWGGVLFDVGSSLLGGQIASTPKSLTKHQIRALTAYFSNEDTQTLLLADVPALDKLKEALQHTLQHTALQHTGKTLQGIVDHLPEVVWNGDNPLYWTNTNKNANHAHFSKESYHHWFS